MEKFEADDIWAVDEAIGVEGRWRASWKRCGIVNIYGPGESKKKIRLWNSLLLKLQNKPVAHWCLIGDFNEVKSCGD